MSEAPPHARGDKVRDALVLAALDLFGEKGFEAASTREIAQVAGTKSAMIAYYFGGKEGLRAACIDVLAERLREFCEPFASSHIQTPQEARATVVEVARALVRGIVGGAPGTLEQFLVREITTPSPSFERLFEKALATIHTRGCEILALATGADPASEELRIRHATLIGQIFYFRFARLPFQRRMGWSEMGEAQLSAIEAVVVGNIEALLEAAGRKTG